MKKKEKNIIKKIEEVIINKHKYIKNILDSKKNYQITFFKKNETKHMGLYDSNNLIISGKYHFYGIYQPSTRLWIWGSSIPGIDINNIKNIKKIKTLNYLFESDNNPKVNFYYQLLSEDVILIPDIKMLDWINELLLYLSNDLYFFNPKNSDGNIQFLTLVNIIDKNI